MNETEWAQYAAATAGDKQSISTEQRPSFDQPRPTPQRPVYDQMTSPPPTVPFDPPKVPYNPPAAPGHASASPQFDRPSFDRPPAVPTLSQRPPSALSEGRDEMSIQYQFSDESAPNADDKYGSITSLVVSGKKALKSGGGMLTFQKNLVKETPILHGLEKGTVVKYDPEDEVQSVLLDTWTEELLKFLALKTITGDNTEPCQLLPGFAVGVAWKTMMVTPSLYSKICLAMGNQHVFDHDPTDTAASRVQQKHKVKRYNATLRAYETYFEEQPAALYWNFYQKKRKHEDDNFVTSVMRKCGVDMSFLSDPLAMDQKTREPGMSPNMPRTY